MDKYLYCSEVQAEPMTLGKYTKDKLGETPLGIPDPNIIGYGLKYPEGNEVWAPKEVFESKAVALSRGAKITPEDIKGYFKVRTWLHDELD